MPTNRRNRAGWTAICGLFICLSVMTLGASGAYADMKAADAARKAGQYEKARAAYIALAEKGDAKAQYRLGDLLRKGQGGKRDDKRALYWYRKAGIGGDARAQIRLGEFYRTGKSVPMDPGVAVSWYRKAAQAGNAWGELRLGEMYRMGQGVEQDLGEAAK